MLSSEAIRQSTKLNLSILGNLALEDDLGNHIKISNRKACGLIAYLAINGTSSETRERLAGLLWSDRGEEQARASLRQCLKQLRKIFDEVGFSGFKTDRQFVSLASEQVTIDIEAIFEDLRRDTVPNRLLNELCEPHRILYGFESIDQSFAAWLHVIRQNWHDRFVDRLQAILNTGAGDTAKRGAEALLKIDPTHEEAHRHLIRHHASHGNTSAALSQYKILWELLDQEFDMEPDIETQVLIAEIKAGSFESGQGSDASHTPRPMAVATAQVQMPVIGVGEFRQGGPWTYERRLIDGFRRELIASLIRFREWVIVEAAELLDSVVPTGHGSPEADGGLDYLLEGTHFEEDGSVRIVITLKDVASHRYIWSESLRLNLDNWFAAQIEIVRRLSVAMNVYMSADRVAQHVVHSEMTSEAYDQWLRGNDLTLGWNESDESDAETLFKEIISHSPEFAPAYSSLASIVNSRHFIAPGTFRTKDLANEAYRHAQKSVAIDPLDTRNQLSLAWANAMRGRHDQAEIHFGLSYELNPNSPLTLVPCAHGFSYCGRHDKARELIDQAVQINPTMPSYHWGYVLCSRYMDGNYAASAEAGERASDVITDLIGWRAAALGQLGLKTEARKTASLFVDTVADLWRGDAACTEEEVVRWFLHCFPIKAARDLDHLKEGLHLAGLPVPE